MEYYILNTINDNNYCIQDNKFYSNNWQPTTTTDITYLKELINSNKDKFKDCIITTI